MCSTSGLRRSMFLQSRRAKQFAVPAEAIAGHWSSIDGPLGPKSGRGSTEEAKSAISLREWARWDKGGDC